MYKDFNLLETILYENEHFYLSHYHIQRLLNSAKFFNFKIKKYEVYEFLQDIHFKLKFLSTNLEKYKLNKSENIKYCIRIFLNHAGKIHYTITNMQDIVPLYKRKGKIILKLAQNNLDFYIKNKDFIQHKTDKRQHYDDIIQDVHHNKPKLNFSDILIFNNKNNITEATRANIAILNNDNKWYTPPLFDTLLAGTLRQSLLYSRFLICKSLSIKDVYQAKKIIWFNSLRGINEAILID